VKPTVGQIVTVRGISCRIVRVHSAGTVDVLSLDGRFAWRISGLGFEG
jgi:hypothetical protein